jgi:hypothetical protein
MKPWGARTSISYLCLILQLEVQASKPFIYLFTYLFIYSRHSSQCPNGK